MNLKPRLAKSTTPPYCGSDAAVIAHVDIAIINPTTAPAVAATLLVLDHNIVSAIGTTAEPIKIPIAK